MNRCLLLGVLAASSIACGGATREPTYPSSPSSPYSSSGSFSGASTPSSPGVPAREQVTAGVVVRPDLLCVPFAVHVIDPDADKAVGLAQGLAEGVAQKLRAIAPNGTVRMRGIAVNPTAGYGKTKEKKEATSFALVADGVYEVPLAESVDYWARSRMLSLLVAASKKEHEARAGQPASVSFEAPHLRVSEPELHRAKLTSQWVERARAFAEAAQSSSTPLFLVDCAAPGEITQRHVSTEEVALTLSNLMSPGCSAVAGEVRGISTVALGKPRQIMWVVAAPTWRAWHRALERSP